MDLNSNVISNEPILSFTPQYCKVGSRRCVTLLAGYKMETQFVENHIKAFDLSVEVIYFGSNLRNAINLLYRSYHPSVVHRKFMVFDFSPSTIIDGRIEFSPIVMPNCKEILDHNTVFCAYTHMPVTKYYNVELSSSQVYDFTTLFNFNEQQYKSLIEGYEVELEKNGGKHDEQDDEGMLNNLACEYVKENREELVTILKEDSNPNNRLPEIKIGLLLPESPSIYGNIEHVAVAAINSINQSPDVLNDVFLSTISHTISCDAQAMMSKYLSYHTNGNVAGVLGPPCTRGLDSVSTFSEVIGMATISYGASLTSFSESNGYRNFFRMVGESRFFAEAVLGVLKHFNWKRVATLSEEGLASSYLSLDFDARLKSQEVEVLMHYKLPVMEKDKAGLGATEAQLKDLKKRKARIILMEIYDVSTALQVMCLARELEMTSEDGFVWIVPSWLGDYNFDSQAPNDPKLDCTRDEIAEMLEHQFSFHFPSFARDDQVLSHLGNKTVGAWRAAYQRSLGKDVTVSKSAGLIFDAVWTYAFALDRMFRRGVSPARNLHFPDMHTQFLEEIKRTNFSGVSGHVNFQEGQSRHPQVILSQWRKDLRLQKIGAEHGLLAMALEEGRIHWPNGIPSDGRPVCSVQSMADFIHVDCDSAILLLTVLASITGAVLASLAVYIYVRRFYNQKIQLSAQVMRNLGIDLMNTRTAPENLLQDWEIPKDQIMLNRKLGEGAFGTVYGGQAYIGGSQDMQAVAVKTLKVGSTDEDRLDFLSEAEAMKRFNHPNILKLLGVCLQSEPIFSVIEFMLYGDLKTYLLARRHLVKERIPDDSDVSAKRLTSMTMDILRGLVYLADQKYVHRDIACRNCLVNTDRRVKIADFGMARPTGSNDYYRFNRKGLLPVRWLSPESLGSGFFHPASDIWSFGVLLFEIISFGAFPYQGLSNNQVLEFVKNGGSMNVPAGVKPPLEKLMKSCWTPDFKKRPTALQILEFVANNPRLVAPCVDVPHFSLQFSDSESDHQLEFMPKENPSPDSGVEMGVGVPMTRQTLQDLAALPTSQAAADAFQLRFNNNNNNNGNGGGFLKSNCGGDISLNYNPVEPLLLRQNSNEMSSSSSSLLMRYVPMCGFGSKKANYVNHNPIDGVGGGSVDDSDYTRMSITEF